MFALDSDILGLLLALMTFFIPVLTAILEKKRKKGKSLTEGEVSEPEHDFIVELFKEAQAEDDPYEGLAGAAVQEQDIPYEAVQEGEPAVVSSVEEIAFQEEQTVGEQENGQGKCLKKRLKENPKEMVLFGEILNPKFKEF